MADSQRKTENLWNEDYTGISSDVIYKPVYVGDGTFTLSTTCPRSSDPAPCLFFLSGNVDSGASSTLNGVWNEANGIQNSQNGYVTIAYRKLGVTNPENYNTMLNKGSIALPYWQHSLRKLTTATEAVENPLYSDGTAITAYALKGNEEHTGTPTPSNPVMPNGVGERTENLFDYNAYFNSTFVPYNEFFEYATIQLLPNTTYTLSTSIAEYEYTTRETPFIVATTNQVPTTAGGGISNISPITITTENDGILKLYKRISGRAIQPTKGLFDNGTWLMLNAGSTAKPYEPYGYKIPISSGGVTTNIYLGSTQTTRQIKKLVLTGDDGGTWIGNSAITSGNAFFNRDIFIGYKANVLSGYCTHYPNATAITDTVGVLFGTNLNFITAFSEGLDTVDKWYNYLRRQYAAGTPVTVWYVLETPQTAAVNEPLMKIGTYADAVSNATSIPTTEGANSITVDTTVQPSEFTATWTGWHDASVKEWDGSQWNE